MNQDLIQLGASTQIADNERFGCKAITLDSLLRAKLPVPPAIALSSELAGAFEARSPDAQPQLQEALAHLRYPLAVRSSANIEDLKHTAAPGLFESVLNVTSPAQLHEAVSAVLASGRTPLVQAYLQAQGIAQKARVAVIIQEQVPADLCQAVLYSRPPGQPSSDLALLEIAGHAPLWIERGQDQQLVPDGFPLRAEQVAQLWRLALQAEQTLGGDTGLDTEWVWDQRGPWLVQARPIVHREELQDAIAPQLRQLLAFSCENSDKLWRLDATHNPLPLSPAQAGLVAAVSDLAPYDMRVVGGYLYTAKRKHKGQALQMSRSEVRHLFETKLLPKMDAALRNAEARPSPSLALALRTYREVFQCYTEELTPALRAAGGPEEGGNPLSRWLLKARQGAIDYEALMDSVSPIAPAWDVAVPTYGETPELVDHALQVTSTNDTQAPSAEQDALSEIDDLLFYRAQYIVRRALLALASRWQVQDLIFFMPLQTLLDQELSESLPQGLLAQACESQQRFERQQGFEMPLAFSQGEPIPTRLPLDREIWQGIGTGGYVQGTVVRVARLADIPQLNPNDQIVLVLPTVSPAQAISARGAQAVICEYGEHLGHGAAMARELNIPCIVGCSRAWRELRTGDRVAVHGRAGLVARL